MKFNSPLRSSQLALLLTAGFTFALCAPSARAVAIIDIEDDAVGSGVWNLNYTSGYGFQVGPGSVTFNALALFDVQSATPIVGAHTNSPGLLYSHDIGVWDSSGTLMASATVDPGDPTAPSANTYGKWVYEQITPVTLAAGTYRIGALFLANADEPRMVQQTVINNDPNVTYLQGMYVAGSSLTAPVNFFPRNDAQYFGPTLFSTESGVPPVPDGGSAAALLLLSCAGLLGAKRRLGARGNRA